MTPCRTAASRGRWERRSASAAAAQLPKPCLQDPAGGRPQRDGAFLATFAMEVEEGGRAKADLRAAQGGHFGDPRAAVIHGQQEGVIAAPHPVGAVGGRQQRLHLVPSQIPNQLLVFPLHGGWPARVSRS